jgi:universal stress protein E
MRHFHNLLYVSHGISDEKEGLKQALSLARNNQAPLKIMIVRSDFPKEFPEYQNKYDEALLADMLACVEETERTLQLEHDAVHISYELVSDKAPAVTIIQHVLQNGYDMVIKEGEARHKKSGFKAIDMDLLRKCPVPVWLCKPIHRSRQNIKVAVAIDPKQQDESALQLSKRMLELSSSLADSCSGRLDIISCWDYEFEEYLRSNIWIETSDEQIQETVFKTKNDHYALLSHLIETSGIDESYSVHHLRGEATDLIPEFVESHRIDILVMGTVARTGIPGFIFGNTAENIVQELTCSLMALKPLGFVSPVEVK